MSKKIVITGGLGYIGTELCKIYSGISWNNEILVIDNRFISERVNQLRNWGIDFIHGAVNNQLKTKGESIKNNNDSEKSYKIRNFFGYFCSHQTYCNFYNFI